MMLAWQLKENTMTSEVGLLEPVDNLDTDEARAAYLNEAFESDDPACIADALEVISKWQRLHAENRRSVTAPAPRVWRRQCAASHFR